MKVAMYLGDCFDGISALKFNEDGKSAVGMYSKEDEYVTFPTQFNFEGAVEIVSD